MRRGPGARSAPRAAVLAALLAALPAGPARAEAPASALGGAADALAAEVGAPVEGRRALGLAVDAHGAALTGPLETALSAALAARGWAVTPLAVAPDLEASARARGLDWLLRVQAGVAPGRAELALVGELLPTWASFFLQRRPGARPVPPRLVEARAPADAELRLLARPARPPDASRPAVRTLAELPGRVRALAAGDLGAPGGTPGIVAVTDDRVLALSASGAPLAERALPAEGRAPVRAPRATAAVGDLGAGRIGVAVAGAREAELLALADGRLDPAGALAAAPLCTGAAGPLFGAFAPGTSMLLDLLLPHPDPAARPASPRQLVAVAAAPGAGAFAFGVLDAHHRLTLLDAHRAPAAPPLDAVGDGFALADLDGDGTAEVVASSLEVAAPDRIRVLAPRAPAPLAWESPPIPGAILAGAAFDLTGDGVDDALLAAVSEAADGSARTTLLLVTADPRAAGAEARP